CCSERSRHWHLGVRCYYAPINIRFLILRIVLQDQPIGAGSHVCQTSPEPNFRVDSAIQARPAPSGLQTFPACPLPTGRFSAPFFFFFGFLSSLLHPSCSPL